MTILSGGMLYCRRITLSRSMLVGERPTTPRRLPTSSSILSIGSFFAGGGLGRLGLGAACRLGGLGGLRRARHDEHHDVLAQDGDDLAVLRHAGVVADDREIGLALVDRGGCRRACRRSTARCAAGRWRGRARAARRSPAPRGCPRCWAGRPRCAAASAALRNDSAMAPTPAHSRMAATPISQVCCIMILMRRPRRSGAPTGLIGSGRAGWRS